MANPETMSASTIAALTGQPAPVTTTATPAPAPISTNATDPGKATAPATSQANAAMPSNPTAPAVPATAQSGQAEPAISDDQLLNAAGLAETPDKKLGRIEREYSASSKEARRLSEYVKRMRDTLDEQGLVITEDEQKLPAGFYATKKYNRDVGELAVKFKDLPEDQQELFQTEPQKAIDMLIGKAKKALIKVTPTVEQLPVNAISPERHETALAYLNDAKWETGDSRFSGIQANRKLIEQMLNAPTTSKALKDFYNQEPELAVSLLHLQLEHARSHIKDQIIKAAQAAKAKTEAANSNPTNAPSGGGTPTLGQSSATGDRYTDSVLNTMKSLRAERDRT